MIIRKRCLSLWVAHLCQILILYPLTLTLHAAELVEFSPNTTARASEVNGNFRALNDELATKADVESVTRIENTLSEQRKTVYRASEFIPPVGQWTYVYNNSASLNSLFFVFVDVQADGVITKTELDSRAYPPNRPPQSLADIEALNIYPHGERLDSQTGNYYFTHWGRVQVDTNMALPSQFSVGDNWIEAIVFTPLDDLGNPIPPGSRGMSTSYITSDNMHFHWNSSYSALGNQVNTDRCVAVTASTNNLHVNRIFCAGVGVVSWGAPSTIVNGIEWVGVSFHLNSVLPGYVFPELPQN